MRVTDTAAKAGGEYHGTTRGRELHRRLYVSAVIHGRFRIEGSMSDAPLKEVSQKLSAILERVEAPSKRWYTIPEAATYTGLSDESIRRLIAAGDLIASPNLGS